MSDEFVDFISAQFAKAYAAAFDRMLLGQTAPRGYMEWRRAFYAERLRYMEGGRFAVLADTDAEAIYLLTRAGL